VSWNTRSHSFRSEVFGRHSLLLKYFFLRLRPKLIGVALVRLFMAAPPD
jgi:hypothetical protein